MAEIIAFFIWRSHVYKTIATEMRHVLAELGGR
jgi:hypothetical protein